MAESDAWRYALLRRAMRYRFRGVTRLDLAALFRVASYDECDYCRSSDGATSRRSENVWNDREAYRMEVALSDWPIALVSEVSLLSVLLPLSLITRTTTLIPARRLCWPQAPARPSTSF